MGLLNVYNNRNKVTSSALAVDYSCAGFEDNGHDRFKCTRTAKKRYKYVGMDYETAKACADNKRQLYTRKFIRESQLSGYSRHNQFVIECPSGIQPTKDNGNMWSVDIAVNEIDTIVTTNCLYSVEDFEHAFEPYVGNRSYDEDNTVYDIELQEARLNWIDNDTLHLNIVYADNVLSSGNYILRSTNQQPSEPADESQFDSTIQHLSGNTYIYGVADMRRNTWIALKKTISGTGEKCWSNIVSIPLSSVPPAPTTLQ